jgi:hypothetical protein
MIIILFLLLKVGSTIIGETGAKWDRGEVGQLLFAYDSIRLYVRHRLLIYSFGDLVICIAYSLLHHVRWLTNQTCEF